MYLNNNAKIGNLSGAVLSCGISNIAVEGTELNIEKGLKIKHFRELKERFPYTNIVSLKSNTCLRESTTH